MNPQESDPLTPIVARVLKIEDVTRGDPKKDYLARYRGRLYNEDTVVAYDQLVEALRPLEVTPLFRKERDRHVVILTQGVLRPKPSNPVVNLILLILTAISVFWAGTYYTLAGNYNGPANPDFSDLVPYFIKSMGGGAAFAASLLAILLAHEFGHYLAGRFHKTHVTLPYFIPFPLNFGTLGAFIQLKEPPKNRRILLDIGIAGPIAGLLVAIPVVLLGLSLSEVSPIPAQMPRGQILQIEGNSILYLLSKYLVFGKLLPEPGSYGSLPPLLYWIRYFFTGQPLPLGGIDVMLHPVAWAGWAGFLVTALNLIPAGQLDGGHLLYVLLGKRATTLLPVILVALALLGLVWPGWWLWAFLIFMLGRSHAEPLDQITTLDPQRQAVAVLGLVIFILVFTPVPLLAIGV
jgi:membrane-associated protease RseP (regulator of RpoE activity)